MKRIIAAQRDRRESIREIENRKLAYEAALEGIVLLKNDGTLPLKPCDIALYGAGARHTVKGGSGSGEVNERHSVPIYEGLKNRGFHILTDRCLDKYDRLLADAKAAHEKEVREKYTIADIWGLVFTTPLPDALTKEDLVDCETAVFVLARQAGEGKDRRLEGSYKPDEKEIASIRLLSKHYRKLILIINSGASVDLSELEEYPINAIVFFCQQGMEGGNALADLLTGKENFSARLTDTWVKKYEDVPFGSEYSYLNGDLDREYYREGIYVGYRYYDTFDVDVRYPFGYGLSYTDFEISTVETSLDGKNVNLKVAVKNIGETEGKQVVQVYVSCPQGKLDKEYQRLVAFAKTKKLSPGETEVLDLNFDMEYCSSFDQDENCNILEKGNYIIRAGDSSAHTNVVALIENQETIILSRHEDLMPCQEEFEELKAEPREVEKFENVQVLRLDATAFTTVCHSYPKMEVCRDERVASIMKKLTLEEKVALVMGEVFEDGRSTDYIYTPGSVARTSEQSVEKGLININLADGPAGVRLLRESALASDGRIKYLKGNYPIASMELFKEAEPIEEGDILLYQYTSAFPVATALAQSFNTDLVEQIGKRVSGEMREFNITYWLAPGMNIHRNPLCGRNFEYYSEDPLLTGKIAAALTKGVQSIKGNYITIKHLACNNAEENRTFSDSIVKARALREIYLKGFEIAVKDAHASGAMTSYNRINGVYASDSYDMSVKILRDEWGFDGVIMTDWTATIEGHASNVQAMKTGHLIMPGGRYYYDEVMKGLKDGSLKEEELDIPVSFLVKAILDSDVAARIKAEDII